MLAAAIVAWFQILGYAVVVILTNSYAGLYGATFGLACTLISESDRLLDRANARLNWLTSEQLSLAKLVAVLSAYCLLIVLLAKYRCVRLSACQSIDGQQHI